MSSPPVTAEPQCVAPQPLLTGFLLVNQSATMRSTNSCRRANTVMRYAESVRVSFANGRPLLRCMSTSILHRQSDRLRMRFEFLRTEGAAVRQSLHDLDPVAARHLRRQRHERRGGAGAEAHDRAVLLDAVGIGGQSYRLAHMDVLELAFLEVRVDPRLVQRRNRHQRRSAAHALPRLHAALGDDARHRRGNRSAPIVEVGRARLRRGPFDLGGGKLLRS